MSDTYRAITLNAYLVFIGKWGILKKSPLINERIKKIGSWLGEQQFDVIFLQEIFHKEQLLKIISSSDKLKDYFFVHFHPGATLAMMSKHPIMYSHYQPFIWQGSFIEDAKRWALGRVNLGLGQAQIKIKNCILNTLNFHGLPHWKNLGKIHQENIFYDKNKNAMNDENVYQRLLHLLELRSFILKNCLDNNPLLIGGDFNFNQFSLERKMLIKWSGLEDLFKDFLEKNNMASSYTILNKLVKEQNNQEEYLLDYFLGSSHISSKKIKIYNELELSDHYPVGLDFHINWSVNSIKKILTIEHQYINALIREVKKTKFSPLWPIRGKWGIYQREKIIQFINMIDS